MERSTVRSLLRSTQAFCSQLCEKQTLEHGIAYYSERFAGLPEANQFREVVVKDPAGIPAAFDEAERYFRDRNLNCHRWAPAGGEASDELMDFLAERGLQRHAYTAMVLTRWPAIETAGEVRVLPARAMRAALRKVILEADSHVPPAIRQHLADAYDERLDDPQFDVFIALVDNRPAGRCALYQVGDIARLMDLCVLAPFTDRGVKAALTAHALALAKRLAMRNILLQIEGDDADARAWFESVGFVEDGTIVEFERQPPQTTVNPP